MNDDCDYNSLCCIVLESCLYKNYPPYALLLFWEHILKDHLRLEHG